MNKRKYFILFALMLATNMFAQVEKIVGEWTTIDDKSGKAVSVVKIYKEKDLYYGKIIKLIWGFIITFINSIHIFHLFLLI